MTKQVTYKAFTRDGHCVECGLKVEEGYMRIHLDFHTSVDNRLRDLVELWKVEI